MGVVYAIHNIVYGNVVYATIIWIIMITISAFIVIVRISGVRKNE